MKFTYITYFLSIFIFSGSALSENDANAFAKDFPVKFKFFENDSDFDEGCITFKLTADKEFRGKSLDNMGLISRDGYSKDSFIIWLSVNERGESTTCLPANLLEGAIAIIDYGYTRCSGATYQFQFDLKKQLGKFKDYSGDNNGRGKWIKIGEPHIFKSTRER